MKIKPRPGEIGNYTCPMLCSQILNGVVVGLRPLSLEPGRDFDVVAISINPALMVNVN